ncbi:MAG: hypothetical protein ACTSVA_03345 [Candidatus Njordarchaeales archaeon]
MEKRVESEENLEEYRRKLREFKKSRQWRTIKVRKNTYELIGKLAEMLDTKRYKIVDLSVVILSILLQDKIVFKQKLVGELGLTECVIRWGYNEEKEGDWAELDPTCVLLKLVLPYYRKKRAIENLMKNIESLSQSQT